MHVELRGKLAPRLVPSAQSAPQMKARIVRAVDVSSGSCAVMSAHYVPDGVLKDFRVLVSTLEAHATA